MLGLVMALALCLPGQVAPSPSPSPPPQPTPAVTFTTVWGPVGDTGGFSLNPWTNFKRDLRHAAEEQFKSAASGIRVTTSTPDLGATPYLRELWAWGRGVLIGTGILVLAVVASAAAGLWPGLNRYAAGAVLPRVVVAVALLAAGPSLLSLVSQVANGFTGEVAHRLPSTADIAQSAAAMAVLPLAFSPVLLVSSLLIGLMGIARAFLLALFVAFGPFANATFAWPGVDRWGKSWWRSVIVLAVVLPVAQAVTAGVTFGTMANTSVTEQFSLAAGQQGILVLVAVVFQALVPLGLIAFSLMPVKSAVGVREGMRVWRALKAMAT